MNKLVLFLACCFSLHLLFAKSEKGDAILNQPTISISTASTSVCANSYVSFTSTVTNQGSNPVYQWRRNGNPVGTNSPSFYSVSLVNGDVIRCDLTVGGTTVSSNNITMTVSTLTAVPVTIQSSAAANTSCLGTNVTFSLNPNSQAMVSPNASYTWKRNGQIVAQTSTYSTTSLLNGDAISLTLVNNPNCAANTLSNSNTLTMTMNPTPTGSITVVGNDTFCISNPGSLYVSSGMSSYVWNRNNIVIPNSNSAVLQNITQSGSYTVTITNTSGCTYTTTPVTLTVVALPTANAGADKSVCAGASTQIGIGAAAGHTYTWSPTTNLSNAYISNPIVSGLANNTTYTVTVTNATGCSNTDAVNITILPLPNISITPSGNTTICVNNSVTLNATQGYTNYIWKKGSTTMQNNANAAYTPTTSGTYTVTVTSLSNNCINSASQTVTINPLPVANAGADKTICAGSPTTIGTNAVAGMSYSWSPATALSNTTMANPTANPVNNTTYTLVVTNTTTGCSNSDAVNITTLALPAAPSLSASAQSVCQASNIVLSPSTGVGTHHLWYKNASTTHFATTIVGNNLTVSAPSPAAENYTVRLRDSQGCLSPASNTVNIWVKPAAVPTITAPLPLSATTYIVCVPGGTSGSATLTANSTTTPAPTYSWKSGGNYVAGANTNTYTQTVTTTANNRVVMVEATYPNGCVKNSANRTIKLLTSGCTPRLSSEKDGDTFILEDEVSVVAYPNPTQDVINIDIQHLAIATATLSIYNHLGQVVSQQSINLNDGKANIQVEMSSFTNGMYILAVDAENFHHTQKVIKE